MLTPNVDGKPAKVWTSGPIDGLPLVLIHGFGNTPLFANRRTLKALSATLAHGGTPIRIIAPVNAGFGGTAPLDGPPTFEAYASWIASLLDALGVNGSRIVVGESMGGAIAMQYAAKHGDDVAALGLINSVGAFEPRSRVSWMMGVALGASIRRKHVGQWFDSVADAAMLFRHPLYCWRAFGSIVRADMTACMAELQARHLPVVMVFGRNDPLIPHRSARVFFERLGSKPILIAADHRSFIDGHQVVSALVSELIDATVKKRTPSMNALIDHAVALEHTPITSVDGVGAVRDGAPVVVGIHGLGLRKEMFAPLAKHVSRWTQFMAVDLPGHGKSDRPSHVLDVDEHAAVLANWLDEQGLKDVVLVGHSVGCQIAVALAESRPELVRSCVLIAPPVDARTRTIVEQLSLALRDGLLEPFAAVRLSITSYLLARPVTMWKLARYAVKDRIELRIPLLSMPVMVVRGERDPVVSREWAALLADSAKDGSLHTVPGAHHAHWKSPEVISELMRQSHQNQ